MSKVLVVDDSPAIGMLVSDALQDAGHTVEVLTSSEHALRRVQTWQPEVVLLDILLGPRSGFAVLADILLLPQPPPVYMMSAGFITSDAAVRLLGAAGFVSKAGPFLEGIERVVGAV